jgi:hypothetical protein
MTAGGVSTASTANIREAAIRALPLQAQILAEQATLTGNKNLLVQAQEKLSTAFQLQSQYEERLYNYNKAKIDAVYEFASKEQQAKLDEKKAQKEQDYQLKRDELARQHDIAMAELNQKNDIGR